MNVYLASALSDDRLKERWQRDLNIYLAGGITGNLIQEWKRVADNMNVYLAGSHPGNAKSESGNQTLIQYKSNFADIALNRIFLLESFYYIRNEEWLWPLLKKFKGFMLDSGAFTFMVDVRDGHEVNWEEYVRNYAAFINEYDIDLFFELDIDNVVGIERVENLRSLLEKLTGRKCIPVWHVSRGHDYWLNMIKEYDYVAIGGIVAKEIMPRHYPIFTQLIEEARQEGTKVHALGFTALKGLRKYRFHSVDSTAWLSGNRFGGVYYFTGNNLIKINKPENARMNSYAIANHNFEEWVKFSEYAEKYL